MFYSLYVWESFFSFVFCCLFWEWGDQSRILWVLFIGSIGLSRYFFVSDQFVIILVNLCNEVFLFFCIVLVWWFCVMLVYFLVVFYFFVVVIRDFRILSWGWRLLQVQQLGICYFIWSLFL